MNLGRSKICLILFSGRNYVPFYYLSKICPLYLKVEKVSVDNMSVENISVEKTSRCHFYIIQSAYSFSVLLKMYSQILTRGLLAVTSMPIVPGEPESVSGQVKVLDLLRQDGGVPLFPACDGNDVTRLVL